MYVGFGYSSRSEEDAFKKAIKMVKEIGVKINSLLIVITAQRNFKLKSYLIRKLLSL